MKGVSDDGSLSFGPFWDRSGFLLFFAHGLFGLCSNVSFLAWIRISDTLDYVYMYNSSSNELILNKVKFPHISYILSLLYLQMIRA